MGKNNKPLKILFVINSLPSRGNGLAASARQTMQQLRMRGHEVRALSSGVHSPDFALPQLQIPVLQPLISAQGYCFARARMRVIRQAVAWADIVHVEEPFLLQFLTARVAQRMGKTVVGTYHIHPENMTASVHLDRIKPLNWAFLYVWKWCIFRPCAWVQCPSVNVRDRLVRVGFSATKQGLPVISNGFIAHDETEKMPPDTQGEAFTILSIGRFSQEKDQITLLRAMRHSAYAHLIQLRFAGRGPTERYLKHEAHALFSEGILQHQPTFEFMNATELALAAQQADLYVHTAFIEVEGMSCLEAIRHGLTPVIATADLSATAQFAQHPNSLFPARNPRELAQRIDFWIENPQLRLDQAKAHRVIPQEFQLDLCIDALEQAYYSTQL
ncbi:glycosyltransferase [Corynebacterium felinum]|uniref:Glycosyltransferase involved in cell wall biosynthesis n=2 Tax=Corynebacterium felinum TaxID=131318 RepID=A0ABU2B782_9CORY|nr:glycosyltransferase [Corynebacterium felinum]MDF5820386.1 glycosyltransferase [Corynebacterium felinum]MDR7354460.1 glycosyltransferase involved in cell wall biosynthesis [Corynebacterium felinum]